MSAWMHSDDTFHIMATAMISGEYPFIRNFYPMGFHAQTQEQKLALVNAVMDKWYAANRNAVFGRYGRGYGRIPAKRAQTTVEHMAEHRGHTLMVVYKLLHSLQYQCAEDVAARHKASHAKAIQQMKDFERHVADVLLTKLPEYAQAPWST